MSGMKGWVIAIVGAVLVAILPLYEAFVWTVNYKYVPEGYSLLLRYKGPLLFTWDNKYAPEGCFAKEGEIGVLENMPGPGRHFYCPIWWERKVVEDVVVRPGELAVITSKLGADLPGGQFLVEGDLGETKQRGILRRTFGPGRYRINRYGYEPSIVKSEHADVGGRQFKDSGWVHINPGYVGVMTYLTDNAKLGRKPGIQSDTLPPGLYPVNPREMQIDLVSIGFNAEELSTEKMKDQQGQTALDESGEEQPVPETGIGFPSSDGFKIFMDFSAVWGVLPHQAPEIIRQTRARITHFVAAMGTSGTFTGVARRLRHELPSVECISVQPSSGFHGIEGVKHMPSSIVPGIYDPTLADRNLWLETEEAHRMARRMAREEGVLVGISAGANVAAALQVGRGLAGRRRPGVIVTVLCDGGEKYLSEEFWDDPD